MIQGRQVKSERSGEGSVEACLFRVRRSRWGLSALVGHSCCYDPEDGTGDDSLHYPRQPLLDLIVQHLPSPPLGVKNLSFESNLSQAGMAINKDWQPTHKIDTPHHLLLLSKARHVDRPQCGCASTQMLVWGEEPMPDPKKHIDKNYTYVKGHVRKKRSGIDKGTARMLAWIAIIGMAIFVVLYLRGSTLTHLLDRWLGRIGWSRSFLYLLDMEASQDLQEDGNGC